MNRSAIEAKLAQYGRDHPVADLSEIRRVIDAVYPAGDVGQLTVRPDGMMFALSTKGDRRIEIHPTFIRIADHDVDVPGASPDGEKYGGDRIVRWTAGVDRVASTARRPDLCPLCFNPHPPGEECR